MNIETIALDKLHPFEDYPFRVLRDEALQELAASIALEGIFNPLVLRPLENGEYEIISGHRRYEACKLAGIEEVPAIVRSIDRDAAVVMMVDDNLTQRSEILPSEKAKAYKMKMEALRHQGKTSRQVGEKWSVSQISEAANESERQVHRYIRLNELEPELLNMVDEKRIAFGPAVELSYLAPQEQRDLLYTMESEDATPSISQAQRMHRLSRDGALDMDTIFDVMREVKGNQVETIKIESTLIRQHSRRPMTPKQMKEFVIKAIEYYGRFLRSREQNR